jgi:asparagine synthase (glutamine-hydrolysing)
MCGICGVMTRDESRPDPAVLEQMSHAIAHRGPDSHGLLTDGPVGLAVRRLAIIDLEHGDQPIADEEGRVQVVQNGEIYNYRDLRARLERGGHRFATRSDTEVLVHLYQERGLDFVHELRGMFAIALWDPGNHRLILARDRFGIKPLYYRLTEDELAFGSELKSLLSQPGVPRALDLDAVESFLAFNAIPAPLTIFAGIRKLPAGHLLVCDGREASVVPYARPGPSPAGDLRSEPPEELAAELLERLRDSVSAHLVADVPVGVLLSGGLDSSALTALAAQESPRPVSTFSIGFEEESFDELDAARVVAERYGTEHHELVVRPDAAQLLPRLVHAFDEPFADSSALPTYLVSELAAGSVKVALSGEGGDELFGGYYTYVADQLAPRIGPAVRPLRRLVEWLPSSSAKVSFDYKAKCFVRGAHLPPVERHHAWKEIFSRDLRAELVDRKRDGIADPLDLYRARYAETEGAEPLSRLQDLDFGIYLVDDLLVKTDRASMAHSLEARVPFCDPVVAELAFALPSRLKVRGFAKKRLLRQAVAPLLPRSIVGGRKQGFSIPLAAWLRGELEPFAREVLDRDTLRRQGLLQPEAVLDLLDAHVARREDLSRQVWGLMTLTLWTEMYGGVPAGT